MTAPTTAETARYFDYWGKAHPEQDGAGHQYHLLPYHCLDVAAVGSVLLTRHFALTEALASPLGLVPEVFRDWAVYFLALHDVGKFAQSFQSLAPAIFEHLHHAKPTKTYQTRHDTFGYALWCGHLRKQFSQADPLGLGEALPDIMGGLNIWMGSVTGHHGRPPRQPPLSLKGEAAEPDLQAATMFMRDAAFLLDGAQAGDLVTERFDWAMPTVSWWLAGIAVLCDWLGSNKTLFPYEIDAGLGLRAYWSRALRQAETAITQSHTLPVPVAEALTSAALLPRTAAPTELQNLAASLEINDQPQVFILEDLTGSGKTEAAVMLAHRIMGSGGADGLFFALPTMATANAMYDRIRDFHPLLFKSTSDASLVLAHSRRRLVEAFEASVLMANAPQPEAKLSGAEEEPASIRCAAWLADNTKKALLASVGVGTIDQVLMGILHSRHQSMRLLGLFRKVLIVDEVHANGDYVHRLLCILLRFHAAAGGSVILLSATLPRKMRAELLEAFAGGRNIESIEPLKEDTYPLLTRWDDNGVSAYPVAAAARAMRDVQVELVHETEAAFAVIREAVEAGQCVCWIRNTVRDAAQAHAEFQPTLGKYVELFHARFVMGDRLDIEASVQSRFGKDSGPDKRRARVLIATQVVEQSLDLDFDVMISDLAPIDLLIQRAGRLHRHPRDRAGRYKIEGEDERDVPILHVLSPEPRPDAGADWLKNLLPGTGAVYPNHAALWRTAKLLREYGAIRMPADARRLIEGVYGEDGLEAPEGLAAVSQQAEGQSSADRSVASYNGLDFEDGYRAGSQRWFEEAHTPTRLGEPTSQLCLLEWDGSRLQPLYREDTHFPWQMSQVSVRRSDAASEATPDDPVLKQALAQCRVDQPFLKDWLLLVPMQQDEDLNWYGADERGLQVELTYSTNNGLSLNRGDG